MGNEKSKTGTDSTGKAIINDVCYSKICRGISNIKQFIFGSQSDRNGIFKKLCF